MRLTAQLHSTYINYHKNETMVTKKRIEEIRKRKRINIDKELEKCIEKGNRISEENDKILRDILL